MRTFREVSDVVGANRLFQYDGKTFMKVKDTARLGKVYNAICIKSFNKDDLQAAYLFDGEEQVNEVVY